MLLSTCYISHEIPELLSTSSIWLVEKCWARDDFCVCTIQRGKDWKSDWWIPLQQTLYLYYNDSHILTRWKFALGITRLGSWAFCLSSLCFSQHAITFSMDSPLALWWASDQHETLDLVAMQLHKPDDFHKFVDDNYLSYTDYQLSSEDLQEEQVRFFLFYFKFFWKRLFLVGIAILMMSLGKQDVYIIGHTVIDNVAVPQDMEGCIKLSFPNRAFAQMTQPPVPMVCFHNIFVLPFSPNDLRSFWTGPSPGTIIMRYNSTSNVYCNHALS